MKLKKTVLAAVFALTLAASPMQPAMAATNHLQEIPMESFSGAISPQSHIIEWVYKIVNDKLYKRLYNASTGAWVGEWIYVRDL